MGNYQYLEVTKNIGKYIEVYNIYQKIKNKTEILAEKLITNKILEKP